MDIEIRRSREEALGRLQATLTLEEQAVASRMTEIRIRHCTTARDGLIRRRIGDMRACLAYSIFTDEEKRRKILFVTGESNAGKTRLVDHALANDPAFIEYETSDGVPARPLIRVRGPSPFTLRNLAINILEALGFPVRADIKETKAWPEVKRQLRYRRTLFLVIEEAQRTLKMEDEKELQKVSDTLIELVDDDEWPIRLILVGVETLLTLRNRDDQMKNRSKPIALGPVSNAETVKGWVIEIVTDHAGLTLSDHFDSMDCARRCVHACAGNVGSIIELVRGAVENALIEGRDVVDATDFAQAYHEITSCLPHDNVFDVGSWQQVPEGAARLRDDNEDEGDEADGRSRKSRSSKPMKHGERPR